MGSSFFAIWYSWRAWVESQVDALVDSRPDPGDQIRAADRGDVPGWVLITMMTAGIVTALWVVAEPELRNLLTTALNITGDPSK
jgi:hypothetical protein